MSIFKEICEYRTIGSPEVYRELQRKLSIAISRGWVEHQVPVMKPHPMTPTETWYRDTETGQIYSLLPFDERPGSWTEVDPKDLIETDHPREDELMPNRGFSVPPLIGILFLKHEVYGREADDLIRAISELCSHRELEEWWDREIRSQDSRLVLIKARARLNELLQRAKEGGWEMHR